MSKTATMTMSDLEDAFLEDAMTLYGIKPEALTTRERRYTVTMCLMGNPASKYRNLVTKTMKQ